MKSLYEIYVLSPLPLNFETNILAPPARTLIFIFLREFTGLEKKMSSRKVFLKEGVDSGVMVIAISKE